MKKINPYIKICAFCEKQFFTKIKRKKICSLLCSARSVSSNRRYGKFVNCDECGKEIYKPKGQIYLHNYCSNKCRLKSKIFIENIKPFTFVVIENKKKKPKYKTLNVNGKQMLLHRHIMQQHLNRKLESNEIVHHINGDTFDNSIENLKIVSRSEHGKITTSENPHIWNKK
jgi:hypothetical protein